MKDKFENILYWCIIINWLLGGIIFPVLVLTGLSNKFPFDIISIGIIVSFIIIILIFFVYDKYYCCHRK